MNIPVCVAHDPIAMLFAVYKGSFQDHPVCAAYDPIAMLLAVHKGYFCNRPIWESV